MINPNDVNLILFDLHGTISSSAKPMFEAIRRAFSRLGWQVRFSVKELEGFMGASSDEFYQLITPPETPSLWKEVRRAIRQEADSSFRELAYTYPGVSETLKTLRERGYSLALYSNSSSRHMDGVISSLGITNLFDYIKKPSDDNDNKIELTRKIIETFNATAAVVGDSIDDIKAARETGSLSVGALFGYGGKEPEQADIIINKFDKFF